MCFYCSPGGAAVLLARASRRDFLTGALALGAMSTFGFPSAYAENPPATSPSTSPYAQFIFTNGPIYTMASGSPTAKALAVRDGRIVAVGSMDAVAQFRGPDTQTIDLGGRTLLPGFVEPHMHSALAVLDAWLDVGPFTTTSIDQALEKIRAEAAKSKPGEWVRAQALDPSLMPGAPVTRQRLDAVAPNNPVFILESNGHIAYVNSAALKLANVTRDTPNPAQGRFVRDDKGELTGRLEEGPAYGPFLKVAPMPNAAQMVASIRKLFDRASAVGCTSLHDAGIGTSGVHDLDIVNAAMRDDPPVRYSGFLTSDRMDGWVERGIKPGAGTDRFRLHGIKFWSDGSNQARTGYQREPYLNSTSRGALNYTAEQLIEGVQRAHDLGWQVAIHANGDAAIDTTLDVYEHVLKRSPRTDHRHRIEHCSVLHPEQIQRMAKLGVSPSFLIGHVHYWGKAFRDNILGPQRAQFYAPCASALRGGLRISLHSDYNVTPIEPIRYMDNAVNRTMRDGGGVLNPAERITVAQALRAVTIDAAWQCQMDQIVGSLETGKYADLVIVDKDPLQMAQEEIGKLKVMETWSEGRRRFAA
ncbi:putative amidohydrolase YtcJ [Cupriavidus metallidurans]|jgi:hypothetical protein|uniref:Metal-dependent amidohydrolase (TAT secreted) n=1 Tax=Cupriavidus metallidurans (strain ATCC 43123 / DSM 2839 / NBRC 102507 / CH34) TaxID=266264 RepID=Q1LSI5_CUPMC|nr:amidohydrolase [Cupriavidus metallidurans]ABF06891.1 Putative metal-dependent amidohydrolase (TAT secreted) [Cupriavidus metallidurans CH34]KWW33871.1 N-substituted formamide deformylase [Cupriavidus metallidurans]MDE4916316.1 amidohydrolase [Cupriavidus metallidurans]QGS28745.1 amidohydrolase family protein [Cupriavidus metallidurans]